MTTHYFHFMIGSVQTFVTQARRTRDFWAGSFILSWLTAVAMRSVEKQQGEILLPKPDKNYLDWLEGKGKGDPPRQGCLPNRFKAAFRGNFDPDIVIENVETAWHKLSELVWQKDLAQYAGKKQREIWERQTEPKNFWEMSWVLTDNKEASKLLDRRKNWRSYFTSDEPGVKCLIMEGWQELSATPTPHHGDLEKFWKPIRENKETDLAEYEYLCAIAFVKRRFARYFGDLRVKLKGWETLGWDIKTAVPSVSYMAAAHWLEQVILTEKEDKLSHLFDAAEKMGADHGEWKTDIRCLRDAYQKQAKSTKRTIKPLIGLDGSVFFESVLQNEMAKTEKQIAQAKEQKDIDKKTEQKQSVVNMLKALNALDIADKPSPFYAILLMDGDSLGEKMSQIDNQEGISTALERFTTQVPDIVDKNNGFLVYAGGDNVLAILPLEDVFKCAVAVHGIYGAAFKGTRNKNIGNATISAAIEFAHIKTPLTKILRDSRHLLDNIAKEGCGRDAIAVRVWKPGGKPVEWAMPWKCALDYNKVTIEIENLAETFRQREETEKGFSSQFFYKIREHFELLSPANKGEEAVLDEDKQCTLLVADYFSSGLNTKPDISLKAAKKTINTLLNQCRRVTRDINEPEQKKWKRDKRVEVDGALLIRFLANKGVES